MFTIISAYTIISIFFLIERLFRKGEDAKTLERTSHDKKSTGLLGTALIISFLFVLTAPILNHFSIGSMSRFKKIG